MIELTVAALVPGDTSCAARRVPLAMRRPRHSCHNPAVCANATRAVTLAGTVTRIGSAITLTMHANTSPPQSPARAITRLHRTIIAV